MPHSNANGMSQKNVLSVAELAHELRMSKQSTYAALRSGEVPHIRIGRRFIVPRTAVEDWLRNAGRPKIVA